ncbi:hypothetical protein MAR_003667 [Mya arenaria]|uniref:Uncharacterized protein n=1 Tax=Mya arenaria TaxID=6604 RepID=A0ABY7G9U0_MYAAR|nr:hypothetical protein MAR_003667 [Mya arenaria]
MISLYVRVSEARDLRDLTDLPPRTGLLLSALCIEDGDVRPACLEAIVTEGDGFPVAWHVMSPLPPNATCTTSLVNGDKNDDL